MAIDPFAAVKTVFEIWCRITGDRNEKKERKGALELAHRFLEVHRAHNVLPTQIPRALNMEKELQPRDILSSQRLAECLNSEMMGKTCELYGIQREWLDGDDFLPYPSRNFYKNPGALINFLKTVTQKHEFLCLWCFKAQDKPLEKLDNGELFAFLVADNFQLGEKTIEKFYPLDSDWPWDHGPARLDFKTLVYVCQRFGIHTFGRSAPMSKIGAVTNGKEFPSALSRNSEHWHPDDYVYSEAESVVAKEAHEAKLVRENLREKHVYHLLPPIGDSSPERVLG